MSASARKRAGAPVPNTPKMQGANGGTTDLYVKGLPADCNEPFLKGVFELYCTEAQIFILSQDSTESVILLRVGDATEARWMVDNLNGNIPQGLERPIGMTYADQPSSSPPAAAAAPGYGATGYGKASGKGFPPGNAGCGGGLVAQAAAQASGFGAPAGGFGSRGTSRFHPYEREGNANANIYVWQLPMGANDDTLMQIFGGVGEVVSVRANPDRRYGFVQFKSAADAHTAIETINGMQINGTTIKCKYADRDKGNVNRPPHGSGFSPGGAVLTPSMQTGLMNGLQATAQAVAEMVAHGSKPVEMYVMGLPGTMTDSHLKNIFNLYCTVSSCSVLSQDSNEAVGFLSVEHQSEAKWMMENLNGNIPQGLDRPIQLSLVADPSGNSGGQSFAKVPNKPWRVSTPSPNSQTLSTLPPLNSPFTAGESQGQPSSNVYVWQLPNGCDDSTLMAIFDKVGTVLSVKCISEKRYGFVKFASMEEAQVAIEACNGHEIGGTTIRCKFADRDKGGLARSMGFPPPSHGPPQFAPQHQLAPPQFSGYNQPMGQVTSMSSLPGHMNVPHRGPGPRKEESEAAPCPNLYVWQLPQGADDSTLMQLFGGIGNIMSVKCNSERRYGFVKFTTVDEAQMAIETINGLQTNGTMIKVKFADRDKESMAPSMFSPSMMM